MLWKKCHWKWQKKSPKCYIYMFVSPAPACILLGSSLRCPQPRICWSSSSWKSVLRPNLLQYCLPAFLQALCHPLSPSHVHSFVLLLSPPPSLPLPPRRENAPSGRGRTVTLHGLLVVFSPSVPIFGYVPVLILSLLVHPLHLCVISFLPYSAPLYIRWP